MFSWSVDKHLTNLIFSSIDIGKMTHINFRVFGQDSENIGGINDFNIGFLNKSIVKISISFDDI